jgi:O-antigen ligase
MTFALFLGALALGFLINMIFVTVSRTALVTIPIMIAVFAVVHLRWRTNLALLTAAIVLAGGAWVASSALQQKIYSIDQEYQRYKQQGAVTSVGERLEFWRKSLQFFAEAPIAGHGTGSTEDLFIQAAVGQTGITAEVIRNPHNQTLNVAVQWGVTGIVVLYAMWLWHLLLFRGEGLANWIGLLVVVQNIFTSLFNSHLFDFHEGWMYVLGVGVAGGMALKQMGTAEARVTGRS